MRLLDHFERIYIVNLAERADRRRQMDAELASFGLRADGRRIRYFRAIRPEDAGEFPSLGARGCFMSHLAIVGEALADGLSSVLVLEDDLGFSPLLCEVPPAMVDRLRAGRWDFAYLGHVATSSESARPAWQETALPLATTHFYALNGPVIGRVHEHLQACLRRPPGHPLGSPMHVDGAYSVFRMHHPEVVTLIATPSLGGQRSSRSDIHPNRWYDRLPLSRQLVGLARELTNRSCWSQTAPR